MEDNAIFVITVRCDDYGDTYQELEEHRKGLQQYEADDRKEN